MTTTTSPKLPRGDTELKLSFGRPAPAPPRRCRATTGELKQKPKEAAATPSTELQATAILRVARRAAAEGAEEGASGDGAAAGLSMRRSMEWFLQRRRESRRQRGVAADSAAAPPSSPSSCSCLTDCS